jgi:tetratricopeptide (TPR) repeat protein
MTLYLDLWDHDDPAGTEQRFCTLMSEVAERGDLDAELQLLTQISRAQGLQRRFEEARDTLESVERRLPSGPSTARARWLLETGRLLNSSGDPIAAAPTFVAAWNLCRELRLDGLAVDAAHMAAIVDAAPGTDEWHRRALDLAERSDDPDARRWRGSLANNMGWAAHDAGRFQEALDLFEVGAAARSQQGDEGGLRIARWTVARAKRSLGRLEEALAEQEALKADIAAAGAAEDGYVSEEIAELLLALGRVEDARPHLADALRLLGADPWIAEHEPERLRRLEELAG